MFDNYNQAITNRINVYVMMNWRKSTFTIECRTRERAVYAPHESQTSSLA